MDRLKFGACLNVIKCAIGAGSLTLPYSFQEGGFILSIILTFFLGSLCCYTIYLLVYAEWYFCQMKRNASETTNITFLTRLTHQMSLAEVGAAAFPDCSLNITRGIVSRRVNVVEILINVGIFFTGVSVSATYIDFISSTVSQLVSSWFYSNNKSSSASFLGSQLIVVLCIFPVLLLLIYLPSLSILSITSAFGDIAIAAACITVIAYGMVYNDSTSSEMNHLVNQTSFFAQGSTIYKYFGGTISLFAIHIVCISLLTPLDNFESKKSVVVVSFIVITLSNVIFGAAGYLLYYNAPYAYCDQIQGAYNPSRICPNIMENIPPDSMVPSVIKLLLCVDLLFTIPVVLQSTISIFENDQRPLVEESSSAAVNITQPLSSPGSLRDLNETSSSGVGVYDTIDQRDQETADEDEVEVIFSNSSMTCYPLESSECYGSSGDSHSNLVMRRDRPSISSWYCTEIQNPIQSATHCVRDTIVDTGMYELCATTPTDSTASNTLTVLGSNNATGSRNNSISPERMPDGFSYLIRGLILIFVVTVALLLPDFGLMLNVVGMLCCMFAFILPPMLMLKLGLVPSATGTSPYKRWFDALHISITIAGVVMLGFVIYGFVTLSA